MQLQVMRAHDGHVRGLRLGSSAFFARPARIISHATPEAMVIVSSECGYVVKSVLFGVREGVTGNTTPAVSGRRRGCRAR